MKPAANVIFTVAGILLALHAPVYAQGRGPNMYMDMLCKAEAEVPALAAWSGKQFG